MNLHIPFTQSERMLAVLTPLGEDALLLEGLEVDERVNGLFTIHAALRAQRDDLKAGDLVGASVDFSLKLSDGGSRIWNGFVTGLHEGGLTTHGTRSYAMTVRPKLWLLSQKSDCRIFLDRTSPQIVETLCKEHGISDLDLRITGKPIPQAYSVQWNETDLAYLLRRIEEDGLFYWFEHAQGKHTLVVADHASGYRESDPERARFAQGSSDEDHIRSWRRSFAFTPGKRAGRDWNFETMSSPQGVQPSLAKVPGNESKELYEYPGRFLDSDGADAMMRNRIQATETGFEKVEALSNVRTLAPGRTFTAYDVAKPGNTFDPQVVTAIRHAAEDTSYETGSGQPTYENGFSVMPATTPATPHRTIPRPQIVGSQIALIAGPSGEEIHTDKFGRVKLWFPWDRRARKDGTDTIWVRVGQPWAGGTWGHQVIPRVGMEAVVSYQDGDPDRPLVTALVPDPTNAVPYELPDNKTRMVFRSNSYKSSGFNEMTFEDRTGGENMFFHAQKDHTTKIENNQTHSVGANHANVVGQNQALTVGANQTQEIGGSMNLTVGGTGAGAAALMAPLSEMASGTAGMLGQALGLVDGNNGLLSTATGFIPQIASSLVGMFNPSGQQAQEDVWKGSSPRLDAGTALASAGGALGQATAGLFPTSGVMNTIVGAMRTDHTGFLHADQVGTARVTNIGSTSYENVGQFKTLTVGAQYAVMVGGEMLIQVGHDFVEKVGSKKTINADKGVSLVGGKIVSVIAGDGAGSITLDSDGNIELNAKNISIVADEKVVIRGASASLTVGQGPVLYSPSLQQGSASPTAACMRDNAATRKPFIG